MVLSREYPDHFFACLSLVLLDIGSHWLQMYSQLLASKSSHKDVDPTANASSASTTPTASSWACAASAPRFSTSARTPPRTRDSPPSPASRGSSPPPSPFPSPPCRSSATGFAAARVVRLGGGDAALTQIAALTLPGWIVKQAANVGPRSSCRTLVAHDVPSEVRAKAKRR